MPDDLEPAEPIVPRDSSTVIVLRQAAAALEVFMLERHIKSDFAGGAYVFPGYSQREIAEHLGCHYSTISRRIHAARMRQRKT